MIKKTQINLKLEDLSLQDIKILHVEGAKSTPQAYRWLKENNYSWLSLPEIISLGSEPLLKKIQVYKEDNFPKKEMFGQKYRSVDFLFNSFLYSKPSKSSDEIDALSNEEFFKPNSFFNTYILHNPEFKFVKDTDSYQLNEFDLGSSPISDFNGVLKITGIDGIGWTIAEFKDFKEEHLTALFGKDYSKIINYISNNRDERNNYLQGDYTTSNSVCSPLSLAPRAFFALGTFPFYNHNGVSNDSWDEQLALFPVKLNQ